MGYGDEIMATGLARGLKQRGKRAAFGDGRKIIWGPWCEEMFAHNPNIAKPGSEGHRDLVWIAHYKGARKYNKLVNGSWKWNYEFTASPGEFFFSDAEKRTIDYGRPSLGNFIVIEPNVPWQKTVAPNKDWGEEKYNQLTERLQKHGVKIVQFIHKNSRRKLRGITTIECNKFREAIALLSLARLYVGPEGGMHHAAAAVGVGAVVIMGGFIPPQVVGYPGHVNLTGGAEACGNTQPCAHCQKAMENILVDDVYSATVGLL